VARLRLPLPRTGARRALANVAGWTLVCWVVVGWHLGYPSFWDPDEATYAQASREMLAAGDWLVPTYDGRPFFDKPPLFYVLQITSFAVAGTTEIAARSVTALSTLALFAVIAWCGRRLFNQDAGRVGALMFAVLPGTFALSAYAILDMTFTLFLFGAAALVVVSALEQRPRLQYAGYVCFSAAVLTKGPLALVLAGLAFLLALALAPDARRPLLSLRWGRGLAIVGAISLPWFLYMWHRFGDAFIDGYALNENLWLYTRPLFGAQRSMLFYPKVMSIGLLPWTPLLAGRLVDAVRGRPLGTAERLLWAWSLAVVGFFTFSQFKLDHYVFPAAPALCLLCARAWDNSRRGERSTAGCLVGAASISFVLIASGIALAISLQRVPLDLPPTIELIPIALIAAGLAIVAQVGNTWRPAPAPFAAIGGLLVAYAVVLTVALPVLEQMKPTRRLAQIVSTTAQPEDHVATFRMNRWRSSWRFYVDRHADNLETPADLEHFLARPGRHYCAMMRQDYDNLGLADLGLRVIHEERGLFTTTGRGLRAGNKSPDNRFIVVSD